MKITILKNNLNEAIQHVSKAISNRTAIPILSGIKIDVTHSEVTLTASDTEISIQCFISNQIDDDVIVQVERTGSVVLQAKFFVEMVRKLPSSHVEIEVGEQFQTTIRSGSTEIQIVGLDPEEFPQLPRVEENHLFSVSSDKLKTMIRQTVFSVSTSEMTPILTGVHWELTDGLLKFTATDRHRLASSNTPIEADPELTFKNIVISGKTLNELNKIISDQAAMIDIVVADNQVLFKFDRILFYSRILDGTYPDTSKIIPNQYKTELILQTKMFADAIDRAYLLSREEKTNIVRFITKEDGRIEVSSSSSELGKVTEQLEVKHFSGEPLKISFNSRYMLDVLKVAECEWLHIGFTGAMSPIIMKPTEETNCLHLILPYRTTT